MSKIIDITERLNKDGGQPKWDIVNAIAKELEKTENCEDYTEHLDNVAGIADTLASSISLCFAQFLEVYGDEWVNNAICDLMNQITDTTIEISKFIEEKENDR